MVHAMRMFMGGFFVVFGGLKLYDLQGFVNAFAEYDLVAQRSRAYGFAYPFIELLLGVAYLAGWQLAFINSVTIVVLGVGSVGVARALLQKQHIRCACLGTFFKLPMSRVTLFEDLLMVVMAAAMLLIA